MDPLTLFLMSNGFRGGGSRRFGKARKPKKQPKNNWFEELKADECKALAKAAKLKVTGTKKDLVERLMEHDFVGQFGGNKRRSGFRPGQEFRFGNMISMDALKEECRSRLLQVSGNKFDLVLRITQHEHGTGGDSLKRAATQMQADEMGNLQPVAKKRKPSKPNPNAMYTRVQKKCQASSQKKYQSHWGSKSHAPDVENLMYQLISSLKEYTETDPKLVIDCCNSVISACLDNYRSIYRPGLMEDLPLMAQTIVDYISEIRDHVSKADLESLAKVMMKWYHKFDGNFDYNEYDMFEAVHTIRNGPDVPFDKEKAVEDDVPPVGSMAWYLQAKQDGTLKMYTKRGNGAASSPSATAADDDDKKAATKTAGSPDTAATESSTGSNENPEDIEVGAAVIY